MEWQDIGIYKPRFDFTSSEKYRAAIDRNLERQKEMVKEKRAVICTTAWTVNGSKKEGRTMVGQDIRLTLRAFNSECEAIIGQVTWRNIEASRERISSAFEQINKLKTATTIEITRDYLDLKLEQLALVHENALKLREEKDEARRLREIERENSRAQREIEESLQKPKRKKRGTRKPSRVLARSSRTQTQHHCEQESWNLKQNCNSHTLSTSARFPWRK